MIVIDPGHGGSDPGALGETNAGGVVYQASEAEIALGYARAARDLLHGQSPTLTRDADVYVELAARADLANRIFSVSFL